MFENNLLLYDISFKMFKRISNKLYIAQWIYIAYISVSDFKVTDTVLKKKSNLDT